MKTISTTNNSGANLDQLDSKDSKFHHLFVFFHPMSVSLGKNLHLILGAINLFFGSQLFGDQKWIGPQPQLLDANHALQKSDVVFRHVFFFLGGGGFP